MTAPAAPSPDAPAERPVLLFMHIPKTAGSSLRAALGDVFPAGQRLYLYPPADLEGAVDPKDFGDVPRSDRRKLRFVMGHFSWGIHEAVPGPSQYVTMLRDPLDRVASLYYHYKSLSPDRPDGPGAEDRAMIRNEGMSLEEWVFQGERLAADNGMVRQIAAHRGIRFGQCPDTLLTEALQHITQRFAAVLVRGRMRESLEILSHLARAPIPSIGRRNVNNQRAPVSEIDPTLRKRIRELNSLDYRLFQLMLERFPATFESVVGRSTTREPHASSSVPARLRATTEAKLETATLATTAPAESTPSRRHAVAVGDQTLCFMHVAKTGGTAMRVSLEAAYAKDERAYVYEPENLRGAISVDQLAALPDDQRQRLRLVIGHFPYGIHGVIGRPCRYMVVIREPVDRIVSLYYHYLHLSSWRRLSPRAREQQRLVQQSGLSLENWAFDQNRLAVDNGMTRNLAARGRVRFGKCPDDLLDEALEHVDKHFAAMLVTDRLDESTRLLEEITGRRPTPLTHANENEQRRALDELDPRLLDRIRELNRLDMRLYETARKRLAPLLDRKSAKDGE